jgi:hypothetical protein
VKAAVNPRGVKEDHFPSLPREKETDANPENHSQGHFQFPCQP